MQNWILIERGKAGLSLMKVEAKNPSIEVELRYKPILEVALTY